MDVFVTDYSRNPELYTKDYALLTSALSQTNITNATHDAIRVLAADGYLLKVAFRDAYWVEAAKKMRPGQIVRLKNLALKSYEAYLVGQVSDAKWASSETKDVTTTTLAQAPDEFKMYVSHFWMLLLVNLWELTYPIITFLTLANYGG